MSGPRAVSVAACLRNLQRGRIPGVYRGNKAMNFDPMLSISEAARSLTPLMKSVAQTALASFFLTGQQRGRGARF